ncbi:EscU/YscU/HrcU family type III secretion system export apparatus switch protein [Natranaerofaba carboxydovora]|uniref:EscU/YscU/HrcU family type III secretion system export apparatus switch protein n=1 Tax=Natranaerofaba carboxydovora TaxID=2742683 RepID=UPI001F137B29|nr:EscU/YscU/HrcU family type III secretion system export apparatus switch protein [Natranaerofaba carboxydovora]UMZ75079.1 Flagellar biosynthetic protein FlhB [Natranaerofaba carboxydovora]
MTDNNKHKDNHSKIEYNGLKKAIALGYHDEDAAPKVLASGKGKTAEKILEIAKEEGIHIYKDEDLAESLKDLDIGENIPFELYQAVAEVLAFVYRMDEDKSYP